MRFSGIGACLLSYNGRSMMSDAALAELVEKRFCGCQSWSKPSCETRSVSLVPF